MRQELKEQGSPLQKSIKLILNSLWGRCQANKIIMRDYIKNARQAPAFEDYNYDYIYRYKKLPRDMTTYALLKPFSQHFIVPQFSVYVLSHARCSMNDIIYEMADKNVPIYYSNTDCLIFNKCDEDYFADYLGDELGQFKVEHDNIKKFICISPKKYIRIYQKLEYEAVGTIKTNDVISYYERLYRERTN